MPNEWISVKDRLPKNWEDVLVYNEATKVISIGYYYDALGWYLQNGDCILISHWMPVPEPPKGE